MSSTRFDAEARQGLAMVSPPLIYAVLMLAAPLITILAYSFFKDGYLSIIYEFTLENYLTVWADPIFHKIMLRSFGVAAMVTLVTVVLAFPVAYFLSFVVPRDRKPLWLFLITIPFWTSYLIRVFLWKVILGYNGVINSGLLSLGIIDEPLQILYTPMAAYIGIVYCYLPFMVLPLYTNLVKHDHRLLEAAYDLGAKPWKAFFTITLPLSKAGIIAGCMLVMIPAVGEFVIPELLGGPDTLMIGRVLWGEFFNNRDWPAASAVAIVMLILLLIPILIFNRVQQRELEGRLT